MRGNDHESMPLRGDICEILTKPIKLRKRANELASEWYPCANAEQMAPTTQTIVANHVKRRCRVCMRQRVRTLPGKCSGNQCAEKPKPKTDSLTKQSCFSRMGGYSILRDECCSQDHDLSLGRERLGHCDGSLLETNESSKSIGFSNCLAFLSLLHLIF